MTRVGFEPTQHYVMRNPPIAGKPKLESHALTARPSCLVLLVDIEGNEMYSIVISAKSFFNFVHHRTMSSKKHKISGLSGLELGLTLISSGSSVLLLLLKRYLRSDPTPADTFTDQLDSMISILESRANSPLVRPYFMFSPHLQYLTSRKSLSFSAADDKALERFNIIRKGLLYLHPEDTLLRDAIIVSQTIGSDNLWSNKHLAFLASSFTDKICFHSQHCSVAYDGHRIKPFFGWSLTPFDRLPSSESDCDARESEFCCYTRDYQRWTQSQG